MANQLKIVNIFFAALLALLKWIFPDVSHIIAAPDSSARAYNPRLGNHNYFWAANI